MEDRCVPVSSAEHSFFYLLIYLPSSAGWWKWSFVWSLQRMSHKSGRRAEEQSAARSGAGHSHGLHARVWKVGDQTEGRTKCWQLSLFALVLGRGRMIIELFLPKKKHVNASQPHLNRVISSSDDFWYAVFLIIHRVRLLSIPGSPGRSMSTTHPVSAMTWRSEKGHHEFN